LTWTQLEVSKKPLYILNINGYWDPLIALIDHVIKQEFADNDLLNAFKTINSVDDLENELLQNHLR
ncbi:LOG family protein, partial [Paracoccaceae bacterium]|nr:LOG family protein [Paracoccaceae bacterium]